jgi:uncharacterized membrane protein YhhN
VAAAAWVFLVVAAVLAVVDWIGVVRGDRTLEYVGKPGALAALVLVALTLDPADGSARTWFVVALVLSLAGDVFLMLPSDRFVEGLASFLLAHVAYVVGFTRDGGSVAAILVVAIPIVVVASLLGARFLRAATRDGDRSLVGPLVAYMAVIAAMVSCALASGNALAAVGALLFMASDSLIAETRFVGPRSWGPLGIIVSYHVGQALLTVSLVSGWS